jgi:hypothetical protein
LNRDREKSLRENENQGSDPTTQKTSNMNSSDKIQR